MTRQKEAPTSAPAPAIARPDSRSADGTSNAQANEALESNPAGIGAGPAKTATSGATGEPPDASTAVPVITTPEAIPGLLEPLVESAAADLLAGLAARSPDLVAQFVRLDPTHRFAAVALASLPPARGATVMSVLVPASLGAMIGVAPQWALPALSAAMGILPITRAITVLAAMDAAARERMLLTGMTWLRDQVFAILDSYWTEGLGVKLSGELAVSFGIPIRLGAESFFQIANQGGGVIAVKGGGEAQGGLLAGVGGGAYGGIGKKGGTGMGMGAEAEGGYGLAVNLEQDYEIDLFSGSEFVDAYEAIVTGRDVPTTAERLANVFATLETTQYLRATRVTAKPYAEGSAKAEGGFRTATEKTQPVSTRDSGDAGKTTAWWQELTRVVAKAALSARMELGLEVKTSTWERVGGELVPSEVEVSVQGGMEGLIEMSDKVPGLPDVTPPDVGLGGSGKMTFTGRRSGDGFTLGDPTFEQSVSARVEDVEAELSVGFDDLPEPYRESWQEYVDNLGEGEVSFELNVGSALLERFVSAALIEAVGPGVAALQAEGSVEITSKLSRDAVRRIAVTLLGDETDQNAGLHVFERLLTFQQTSQLASVAGAMEEVARAVHEGLDAMKLEVELGMTLGGGGSIAAGAKAEVEGSVGAAFTFERELIAAYGERPTLDEVRNLLRGVGTDGSRVVDLDRYLG